MAGNESDPSTLFKPGKFRSTTPRPAPGSLVSPLTGQPPYPPQSPRGPSPADAPPERLGNSAEAVTWRQFAAADWESGTERVGGVAGSDASRKRLSAEKSGARFWKLGLEVACDRVGASLVFRSTSRSQRTRSARLWFGLFSAA